jgi:rhodanese-related sulfurtransferase
MTKAPMEITAQELDTALKNSERMFILDVRQDWEVDLAPLRGAVHICLDDLPANLERLPTHHDPFVVVCHHGVRSLKASTWLREQGYQAINLKGGIDAWSEEIDPTVPRY